MTLVDLTWQGFKEGFGGFSSHLKKKGIDLAKDFKRYRDQYPILDDLVKVSLSFLPSPINYNLLRYYEKFVGEDKTDAAAGIFETVHEINKNGKENFAKMLSLIELANKKGAKQHTLVNLLDEFRQEKNDATKRHEEMKNHLEIKTNEIIEKISGLKVDREKYERLKEEHLILKGKYQALQMLVKKQ